MKKLNIFTVCFIILVNIFLVGCEKKVEPFYLEEKYYGGESLVEINNEKIDDLISDKESFAVFIYQPLCSSSASFEEVLGEFYEKEKIGIYKMSFSNMKKTSLVDDIEYYPSLVLFEEGEMIDFLEADSDKDKNYYKSVAGFEEWFFKYILIKEDNVSNEEINLKNETSGNNKLDVVLNNVTYSSDKINIYFFWGDGCPHCEEEHKFFERIKDEYGKYYMLNEFEVWHNDENNNIMNQLAAQMGQEVKGVPFTIIGEEVFTGFNEIKEEKMLDTIKTQYKNSYDVYFNNK